MKALTFKEKQDVLEDLFKKYHRAVLQLKCLEERNFYPTIQFDTVKEKKTYYQDKGSKLNDGLIIILEVHTIVLKQGPWKKLCSILVVYKNHKV